jgi:hypothetical protein
MPPILRGFSQSPTFHDITNQISFPLTPTPSSGSKRKHHPSVEIVNTHFPEVIELSNSDADIPQNSLLTVQNTKKRIQMQATKKKSTRRECTSSIVKVEGDDSPAIVIT